MTADATDAQTSDQGNFFATKQRCGETTGFEFIPENGGGAGIRFRERKALAE